MSDFIMQPLFCAHHPKSGFLPHHVFDLLYPFFLNVIFILLVVFLLSPRPLINFRLNSRWVLYSLSFISDVIPFPLPSLSRFIHLFPSSSLFSSLPALVAVSNSRWLSSPPVSAWIRLAMFAEYWTSFYFGSWQVFRREFQWCSSFYKTLVW